MVSALIMCAGSGERAGFGYNKLLADIGGATPFAKCLDAFSRSGIVNQYIIACAPADKDAFSREAASLGVDAVFVEGGATREESVASGLKAVKGDIVLIHDGARPFVSPELIVRCAESAERYGSGVAAIPATDTVCDTFTDGETVRISSSSREGKYFLQTPQAFATELIRKAFSMKKEGETFTDESGPFAKYIGPCAVVKGEITNKKLTYRSDFALSGDLYAGTGFDLHRLVEGRKLILGGIEIPHGKGLLGHSDADVLTHAIMDALLSSAALGDIGKYFPDTDPRYEGISSMKLLSEVIDLLDKSGYKPKNTAAVIMAQKPKLLPYVPRIRANLAAALGVDERCVGLTCTTLEGIGTVGREEGIAVQAYCLCEKK